MSFNGIPSSRSQGTNPFSNSIVQPRVTEKPVSSATNTDFITARNTQGPIQNVGQAWSMLGSWAMGMMGKPSSPKTTQPKTSPVNFNDNRSIEQQFAAHAGNNPNVLTLNQQLAGLNPNSKDAAARQADLFKAMQAGGMSDHDIRQCLLLNEIARLNNNPNKTAIPQFSAIKDKFIQKYQQGNRTQFIT